MPNATQTLVAFQNEMAIGSDGWAQIAPFGDFPGLAILRGEGGFTREKAIQRMDRAAVTQMVNEYQQTRKGLSRFLKSRPLYLGHPDVPGCEAQYPDKSPKGVFSNLACREDGFFGELLLTEEGEALVSGRRYRALSGRWEAEYIGEENGVKIYRPTKFHSAGLTNNPNLPVQLLNEAAPATSQLMKNKLIALLTARGLPLAADPTDAQLEEGLDRLAAQAGQSATLVNEKTQLAAAFAAERSARIGALLDQALREGRITLAERPDWEKRLGSEAAFANELEALARAVPAVKSASIALGRGDRKAEIANIADRHELIADLVRQEMDACKCDYDAAFARVQKKYSQLFQAMKQPEIKQ